MSRVEIERNGVKLGVIDDLRGTVTLTVEGEKRMRPQRAAGKGGGKKGGKKTGTPVKDGYGTYPPKSAPKPK